MKHMRKNLIALLTLVAFATSLAIPLLAHAQGTGLPTNIDIEDSGCGISLPDPLAHFAALGAALGITEKKVQGSSNSIWGCVKAALIWFTALVLLAITRLIAWLLQLAIGLLVVIVQGTQGVIASPVVTAGFKISLSTVNLFFVLVLILIAFATILRLEQYGAKKFLARFIIAVVLINFSFLIAGLLLDFSNMLTNQWIGALANDEKIGAALSPQKFFKVTVFRGGVGAGAGASTNDTLYIPAAGSIVMVFLRLVLAFGFIILFTTIALIVMFVTAIMVLIRYVWLAILLILMPFAWLFWVAPFYREHAHAWWNKFLQWTFFLPAVAFFFFLAFETAANVNETFGNAADDQLTASYKDSLGAFMPAADVFVLALNMVVLLALLVGGLIASQKMGIVIAGAGIAAAVGFSKGFGRFAGRAVGRPFVRPGKAATRMLSRVATLPGVRRIPGMKRAANVLADAGARKNEVEDYQEKNLSNLQNDQVKSMLKAPPAGPVAKAALFKEAKKRKLFTDLDELPEETMISFAKAAKAAVGSDAAKELLNYRPDLRPEADDVTKFENEVRNETGNLENPLTDAEKTRVRDKATFSAIAKHDANDVLNYSIKVLANPTYVAQFNNSKAAAIGSRGSDEQRATLIKSLGKLDAASKGTSGDPALDKYMNDIIAAGGKEFNRIDQLIKFYNSNPSLQPTTTTFTPPPSTSAGGAGVPAGKGP